MKKLSIITVTLNNRNGLENTLKSVISQTFTDFELIVIDGGSTDNSLNVITKYAEHITFWCSEFDNGIYHAMNKGILKAQGEYCYFLNAGDYFASNKVLESIFCFNFTEDIISGNLIVTANNKKIGLWKAKQNITFLDIYSSSIKHQATFIKKCLFDSYGLYDETLKISSDWDFFMKSFVHCKITYRSIDLEIACFDNNGFSNNNPNICQKEFAIIIDRYVPKIMQEDYRLYKKFNTIKIIDKSKTGWFLYKFLFKTIKVFISKN